jgi:hypothetical protein
MKLGKLDVVLVVSLFLLALYFYFSRKKDKDNKKESSFGKWKPIVVSPEQQLKTMMNISPENNSVFGTRIKLSKESSFGGGRGGGGHHGGHHGGHGGRGWGGYGYPYPIYYGGWGGYPYLDYPLLNEPVVIKADKCPEGFVYRGEKEGCKSVSELAKRK